MTAEEQIALRLSDNFADCRNTSWPPRMNSNFSRPNFRTILIGLFFVTANAFGSENLLQNPDFDGTSDPWILSGACGWSNAAGIPTSGVIGCIQHKGITSTVSQCVPVSPSKVDLTVYVNVELEGNLITSFTVFSDNACASSPGVTVNAVDEGPVPDNTTGWDQFAARNVDINGASVNVTFGVIVADALFDHAYFGPTDTIFASDFE